MTSTAGRIRGASWHLAALAILLWPLVGITFVPMVDLPGHLAITRVLDDYLHGQYRSSLHLNLDPVYKPTYVLLYAVYTAVPKTAVGACAIGIMVALGYAAVCWSIAVLAKRSASSPLVVSLATAITSFCYGAAFFWGLLPFLLAVPPALVAWTAYLRTSGVADGHARTTADALLFVVAALVAHAVHPLSSLFLAIMLGPAAVVAGVVALVRQDDGVSPVARLWSVAWPLVAWVPAVAILHRLGTTERQELDVERSVATFTAPFHGLAAARAFLGQIPLDLGLLPTKNPAATVLSYPVAVALVLAIAGLVTLVTAKTAREAATGRMRPPLLPLAAALVASTFVFLFVRHDIVRVSVGSLWYPVRGPGFLVFFFGALAAAVLLHTLERSRFARPLATALAVCLFGVAIERSAVLRVHFVEFDQQVGSFFRGETPDRWIRQQPVNYIDHIRSYNCYFDAACPDHRRLFFSIVPNASIYPLSRIRPPAAEAAITGRSR